MALPADTRGRADLLRDTTDQIALLAFKETGVGKCIWHVFPQVKRSSGRWREQGRRSGRYILGALHLGHAELIRRAASENDVAIVTVYPNKIQLRPGGSYDFNLDEDIGLALRSGATAVISSNDTEMFPPGYRTFVSQGDCDLRLGAVMRI